MKKNVFFVALAATVMVTSCGSQKKVYSEQSQVYQSSPQSSRQITEVEVQLSECEKMSLDLSDGKLRSFGIGTDADPDFARQLAIASAKGQLTQDMQALALNVIDRYRSKTRSNDANMSEATDKQHINITSENMMRNNVILKTAKFMRSDGSYRYEVCVGSVDLMEKVVENILTSDKKLEVDFAREEYIESYQEGLNQFREQRVQ